MSQQFNVTTSLWATLACASCREEQGYNIERAEVKPVFFFIVEGLFKALPGELLLTLLPHDMTEVGWTACSHLPNMPNQRSRGQAFLVTKRLWYSAVIFRRLCKMTVQHRISLRSCTWFKSYFHIRKGQRAASFFILSNLALMSSSICKRSILHPESCNWRSCQASQEESWCCLQTTVYQLSSWQMQLKTCQSKTVLNALCSVLEAAVPEFSGANCSRGLVQQTHSHWIHWRRWVNESAWKGSIETRALYRKGLIKMIFDLLDH